MEEGETPFLIQLVGCNSFKKKKKETKIYTAQLLMDCLLDKFLSMI